MNAATRAFGPRRGALGPSALVLLLLALAGCRTATIYNVRGATFPAPPANDEQIADLIRTAAERQNWQIEAAGPGTMRGTYARGRHRAVVSIEYSAKGYSIEYLDSAYLQSDGTSIHAVYNEWIRQLAAAIDREASFHLSGGA